MQNVHNAAESMESNINFCLNLYLSVKADNGSNFSSISELSEVIYVKNYFIIINII